MAVSTKSRKNIPEQLRHYMMSDNIAEELEENYLAELASGVIEGTETDAASRYKWLEQCEEALKIARQEIEEKNTPWPGASNVKYPLLLKAAIQYNAFTLPQIIREGKVVNVEIMKEDPTKEQQDRALRLSEHMSYQLTEVVENWKSDTDKLLMTLATHGVVYRKSYFDPIDKIPRVDFCLPKDIVINNNVESLEKAERVTHLLHLSVNQVVSRMRAGIYTEYDLEELFGIAKDEDNNVEVSEVPEADYQQPLQESDYTGKHLFQEQHKYLDLDDDGYSEPYIVTVHVESQKVMRILAGYDEDSLVFEDGQPEFIKINPIKYFTDYHFIPAPDGSYHSLGFGHILYPLNETINSITNQLVDAGTLANRGGGFISNGLRINKGPERFVLGEYKKINLLPGQTLAQNIFPMPVKEGSPTLFNLLSFLLSAAEGVANITEMLGGGKLPPQAAATTVLAMIEQGSKVYSVMVMRLHESLKKEYKKLYEINKKYLSHYEDYQLETKSGQIKLADYQESSYALIPLTDPTAASEMHRVLRAQALVQMTENPLWEQAATNPYAHEIMTRSLEALHIENIDKILPKPPTAEEMAQQPPSLEEQLAHAGLHKVAAQIDNINADSAKKRMEKAEIIMDKELQAIGLDLKDEQQQANAAFMGSEVAEMKINSITKMAEIDANIDAQTVEMAEKQVSQLTPPLQEPSQQIESRLQMLESAMQNMMGMGGQSAQPPMQQPPVPPQPEGPPAEPEGAQPASPQEAAPIIQEGSESPPPTEEA